MENWKIMSKIEIPQILKLPCFKSQDSRGEFIKILSEDTFQKVGFEFQCKEIYYSISNRDVIRGMHFQLPPHEHDKIVHVISGAVMDVSIDIRKDSSNYGKVYAYELNSEDAEYLYIPKGFAHGFKALEDHTVMLYAVSSGYDKCSDSGILWNTINYDWNVREPIVSDRDKNFISFTDFVSPF